MLRKPEKMGVMRLESLIGKKENVRNIKFRDVYLILGFLFSQNLSLKAL